MYLYYDVLAFASGGMVFGIGLGCIVIILGYVVRFFYRMISGKEV